MVDDFNYETLHKAVKPMVIEFDGGSFGAYFMIKINEMNQVETLQFAENIWNEYVPNRPFIYNFLEDHLSNLYKEERKASQTIFTLSIIAFCVTLVGLFAFLQFSITRKTKETGIRKILGVSNFRLILYYSKTYVLQILAGFLLALPVSHYFLTNWLQNYEYRVEINPTDYIIILFAISIITLLIVVSKLSKTVSENPVDALRNE